MTDVVRIAANNVAQTGTASQITVRFAELIHPKPEETRTADEIIAHFKSGLANFSGKEESNESV